MVELFVNIIDLLNLILEAIISDIKVIMITANGSIVLCSITRISRVVVSAPRGNNHWLISDRLGKDRPIVDAGRIEQLAELMLATHDPDLELPEREPLQFFASELAIVELAHCLREGNSIPVLGDFVKLSPMLDVLLQLPDFLGVNQLCLPAIFVVVIQLATESSGIICAILLILEHHTQSIDM